MAEIVLSPLIGMAIEKLASREVWVFFRGRGDSEELCEKLRMLLVFMDPSVAYAEQKQITDAGVRIWLNYVRDAVLDAEDLLEEIDVQVTQSKLYSESQIISRWTRRFSSCIRRSFDNKIERMEKIVNKLEFLLKNRGCLQLKNAGGADVASMVEKEKLTSISHPHKIDNVMFGREEVKATIINSLIENDDNKASVIFIVGMGGMGKTLLAQLVYNDTMVQLKFDVRGWVAVSDDFNAKKLLEAILEAITKSAMGNKSSDKNRVQEKLKEELTGKKFLLVLDDVWEDKQDQWAELETLLSYGNPGSNILVTTRNNVAKSRKQSDQIYDLKELEDIDSFKLFVKHAFNDENQMNHEFKEIGDDIVAKCKGLPLALKAMGSLLCGKSLPRWKTVLNSEIWKLGDDKIMPALLLSYHHLPSHLKRCFAFCALFPKGFNFDKEELILLWMGENYLQCYDQNKSMKEVGKEYFDDLLSRSFFQQSRENKKYYVMHNLLNDLAKYVYGNVCFTLEVKQAQSIPQKTRHLSFLPGCIPNSEESKDLYKNGRLRTFLLLNQSPSMVDDKYETQPKCDSRIWDSLSKCRFLRVLSLCYYRELRKVPDSVGNLKHLGSLDLSGTSIQKLPNSTCSLFNLQILKLQDCLLLKELPVNLLKLPKLQHLDLRSTELRKLPMPSEQLKILTDSWVANMAKRGDLLSSFFEFTLDRLASPQVLDFFRGQGNNEELCEKLEMVLLSMDPLVAYAELKQTADERVRGWLDAVRDTVLNAEDLLDEIHIQVSQSKFSSESQTITSRVLNPFSRFTSSENKIERMEEVLRQLKHLRNQNDHLELKNASGAGVASVVEIVPRAESTSRSDIIYGRDDDQESIVDWLTSPTGNDNKVSIISIVGMGGLGKTTLAQLVFNHPKVASKFDVRFWICVSDEFNVIQLMKAILKTISGSTEQDDECQLVQEKLKKKLSGRKFLLVLDDVWNENQNQWEVVRTPLSYGAPGSKILVTTRTREVADSCMLSDKIHDLKELPEAYCWKLFVKHAFKNENHRLDPEFEKIGKGIVAKCKGLPLALKTVGSLLYKKSISYWQTLLNREIWQLPEGQIVPALLLSYHHLPSHLKRCFALCALFPKGFNFDREELILLWMGENYLQCYNQKSMEEVGKDYFHDLLDMSFFQQSGEYPKYYVMHDLLIDLARYVCGDVCFTLEVEKAHGIPKKTRHFSFITNCIPDSEEFKDSCKDGRLHTFLPLNQEYNKWSYGAPICDLLSKCRFLRVLSLCNNRDLIEVPDSLGNLKHLRSLDLSGTPIKKLPDSICSLYDLHILRVQGCESLEELPVNLHKLTKLQHLDLRRTNLRKLPVHLGQLKNLKVLMDLVKVGEFEIQQLGELNLRGELRISEMQNIVDPSHASAVNLESKMHLVKLELEWSEDNHVPEQEKQVLENLRPSEHLEELRIKNYGGTEFPRWFGDDSLSNMVSLELRGCKNCNFLPSLGELPSLKNLSIIGSFGIVTIGEEFYGSTSSSFTSLETLFLKDMNQWKKWECKAVTGAFSKLRELSIISCRKLEDPLPEQFSCLEKLTINYCKVRGKIGEKIEECGSMETLGSDGKCSMDVSSVDYYFPNLIQHSHRSLVDLSIVDCCESLTIFPLDFFPNLRSLKIGRCANLQMISQDEPHNHLMKLSIDNCSRFKSFPSRGLSAPRLVKFSIIKLKNLKSLPKHMDTLLPSLIELETCDCPEMESICDELFPSNLEKLYLWKCSKLITSLKEILGVNTSIKVLSISGMDMECFPAKGFLPSSLTFLSICDSRNLKKVDYRGLRHLSSLTHLILQNCPRMEYLLVEGLPKSISSLEIWNCPLLEHRYQKPNRQDYKKIAYIQDRKFQ